nr:MAG: hypothetical protein 3 [Wuhan Mosquito Virus 6]QRW42496.1 MAG: hypothetical protein 3 [Wuhan Mosquito Virus 6]QRW42497.1 MAG: hypothetical protein 3 [Wuhan Mosquito Virus 6]QRW42498.1 MAG: hypothetical protein 3 [Wuhan Mosquito Virus 6]QRW42501.1 MAG: hypothetical protein 3 [Wuhan Mosquito Virus 6]
MEAATTFTRDEVNRLREEIKATCNLIKTFMEIGNFLAGIRLHDPDEENSVRVKTVQFLILAYRNASSDGKMHCKAQWVGIRDFLLMTITNVLLKGGIRFCDQEAYLRDSLPTLRVDLDKFWWDDHEDNPDVPPEPMV